MANLNFTEEQLKAKLKEQILSGAIEKEDALLAIAEYRKANTPKGGMLSAVWEPTKTITSSLAGQIGAGYSGLFKLATGQGLDAAAETVGGIQEDVAEFAAPKTQTGQQGVQNLGQLMEMGIDVVQFPLSGLSGIGELLAGQGVDQAAKTVKDIQTKGVGQTAGDRAYEETGSAILATAAYLTPELVGSIIPTTHAIKKSTAFQRTMATKLKDSNANPEAAKSIANLQQQIASGDIGDDLFAQFDSVMQVSPPRIREKLVGVAEDIQSGVDEKTIASQLDKISQEAATPSASRDIVNYVEAGAGKIKRDPIAMEAVKQGFDEGVIASVKAATPTDKRKMAKMVDIMEKTKDDPLFGVTNRPTDVAGNSLLERVNHIKSINKQSGQELNIIAKSLKGQPVEFDGAVNGFLTRLDDMGVRLDKDLKPIFQGSDIEGVKPAENAISMVVKRMSSGGTPDAYDLHRLKKYIDEQVTYGKQSEGLTAKTESVLKKLRADIDNALDSQFPEYDAVNTTYADTVGALDALQSVAGKKMDLFGDNADKAVGTLLRRMMSNAQSRINLTDAVADIETVSRKYGSDFEDSIQVQMLFADELDSVMGAVARTGFQRSVGEGVKQGVEMATGQKTGLGILAEAAGKVADKARGISDESAMKTIRKLLER